MRNILQRAWRDTRKSVGLKWRTLVHYIVIPGLAVLFLWFVVGKKQATDEIFVVLCYILIATLLFLLSFLWNLWLAPYKILNERLDKVSDTQTLPKADDEEATMRSRLHIKQQDTLRELKTMRECIKSREGFRHDYPHVQHGTQGVDYEFHALREKYSHWFPPDLKEREMLNWAGRIISTHNTNDYEDAVRRIERAAAAKSWVEGAPNDG